MYLDSFSVLRMRAVRSAGTLFRQAVPQHHRVNLRRILRLNTQLPVKSNLSLSSISKGTVLRRLDIGVLCRRLS